MKLVLINDVKKVGKKGDVVDVKSGYGLNFLIPQGFAVSATEQHLAKVNQLKAEQQKTAAVHKKNIDDIITKIEASDAFVIKAKANEKGGLYEAITEAYISKSLSKAFDVKIEITDVSLVSSIKEVGTHVFVIGDDKTRKELSVEVVASAE